MLRRVPVGQMPGGMLESGTQGRMVDGMAHAEGSHVSSGAAVAQPSWGLHWKC